LIVEFRRNAVTNFKVKEAIRFIDRTYADPNLSLGSAASHVHASPFHLCRLLRACTGMGFVCHVRVVRIRTARTLLETTLLSIKEIAAAVGYTRTNDLDRNFVAMCGVTPTTYRARIASRQEKVIDSKK
jgi:transcriptional regulator GlxA family with amidase domain